LSCYNREDKEKNKTAVSFWRPAPRPAPVCFEDGRNERTKPKPATGRLIVREVAPVEPPIGDFEFFGPSWRAGMLDLWIHWGPAVQLPQGLADGYLDEGDDARARAPAAYLGARHYDSNGILIWHPQPPVDWSLLPTLTLSPKAVPEMPLQSRLAARHAIISGQYDPSAAPPAPAGRRLYFGPVRKGRRRPRRYERDHSAVATSTSFWNLPAKRMRGFSAAASDVPDVVDRFEDAMTREDGFCFSES
jgi:hypothetical protein